MTPQFILWGIPGYIAYYFIQSVRPTRSKSGWDFVVEVGFLALLCFVASRVLIHTGTCLFPPLASGLKSVWPKGYSFTLLLGIFPVSEMVGLSLAKSNAAFHRELSRVHKWATGRIRKFGATDVFFATCYELLGEMIFMTLGSGKVYVGVLRAATEDPNEQSRYVSIVPVLSGFRREPTLQITYTTFYEQSDDDAYALLIAAAEISTLGRFDWDRYEYFQKTGDIEILANLPRPASSI